MTWLVVASLGLIVYLYLTGASGRLRIERPEQIPYCIEFLLAQGAYIGARCVFYLAEKPSARIEFRKYVDDKGVGCRLTVEEARWGSATFDSFLEVLAAIRTSAAVSIDRRGRRIVRVDCKDDIGLANMLTRRFFSVVLGGELEGRVVLQLHSVIFGDNVERLTKVAVVERGKLPRRRPWHDE